YAPIIKISVEERDNQETTEVSFSHTAEFAGNVGYDATWGQHVKSGLKFGASAKISNTTTYRRTILQGSDELGDVTINFADKVILSTGTIFGLPTYNIREYDSGQFVITMNPVRVQ
ncbi:MAG: hypothetical protein LBP63_10090, partial [Prevotellaceae bacterium]|nr:hypothetical protein [Prevotellaceae bacterium]